MMIRYSIGGRHVFIWAFPAQSLENLFGSRAVNDGLVQQAQRVLLAQLVGLLLNHLNYLVLLLLVDRPQG